MPGSTIEGHVSHSIWPTAPYVPSTALGYWEYGGNIDDTNVVPELVR